MIFDVYKITSKQLTPYVQYILFNHSNNPSYTRLITSFANTNICLGIINGKELSNRKDGIKCTYNKTGVTSYLSGMYLEPHKFEVNGTLDEICIDFTPLGFYQFFKFPIKTYILQEDILTEGFGKEAKHFFQHVFSIADFQKRGYLIENYLQKKIVASNFTFLQECLHYIDQSNGTIALKDLSFYLKCSEKKIVRSFLSHFDLTPKDYIRIVKFRKALGYLNSNSGESLTSIGYACGYYDQSHFIKDLKFFTEKTPKQIKDNLHDVKQKVIIGID